MFLSSTNQKGMVSMFTVLRDYDTPGEFYMIESPLGKVHSKGLTKWDAHAIAEQLNR